MLTNERQNLIVQMVEQRGAISLQELVTLLDTSESTIRRDLFLLDEEGLIKKVRGGAIAGKQS